MESTLINHDIMISYSSKLRDVADDICYFLKENEFDVWMAPHSIPKGEDYINEIYAAIDNSKIVLFVLSDPSLKSEWCQKELIYAIESNKKILPVQINEVENPYQKMKQIRYELQRKQILVLFPSYKAKLESVVDSVKKLINHEESVEHPYPVLTSEYSTQNIDVVGREQEIKEIHNSLKEHQILNVYGMGGIGKSSVLKKFCATYLNSGGYQSVHLAKFRHSIQETVAAIPFVGFNDLEYWESLKDASLTKDEALMEKKLSLLDKLNGTCLLIIDGADYLDEEEFAPLRKVSCPIIIVSRNRYPYDYFNHFELKEMAPADSLALFLKHCKIETNDKEETAIQNILKDIGNHTLTAKLIACYCNEMGLTPSELLEEGLFNDITLYDDHKARLSTLLDKSHLSEKEIYALQVLSLFPNGILKGKFQKIDRDTLRVYPQLVEKGWVIGTDSAYQLHQIVQKIVVAKHPITSENIEPFLSRFIALFRQIGMENSDLVLVARNINEIISGNDYLMANTLHLFGNFLCDVAYSNFFHVSPVTYESQDMNFFSHKNDKKENYEQFQLSLTMNKKAYEIATKLENEKEKKIIPYILSYMGATNFNMNQFEIALAYQRQAIEAAQQYLAETDFEYLVILDRIGLTALEVQDYKTALDAFTKRQAIATKHQLADFNYALSAYHIGLSYFRQGDYQAAKEWFIRSENELKDDKETSFGYSELCLNLAEIYKAEGNVSRVREYFLRSKAIKMRIINDEDSLKEFIQKYDALYMI